MAITDWKVAKFLIDDQLKKSVKVNMDKKNVSSVLKLAEGKQFLRTDLTNSQGKRTSAYFATVEYLEK